MKISNVARGMLRRMGYDIVRVQAPVLTSEESSLRRMKLLNHYDINLILDVGANSGQFAVRTRQSGYKGRIVSFEPLASVFRELQQRVGDDASWKCVNIALGDCDGNTTINVAGNQGMSSSMLEMLPRVVESAPEAGYIGTEIISLNKLDSVFATYHRENDRVLLKIDTQGFEKKVLEGGEESLSHISGIQMEMSLVPLYNDEPIFTDMISYLSDRGFELMHLEAAFDDPKTGRLLQCDGMFFRPQNQHSFS